jgi:glycosyltransferase involved in cell wall biosynthesis
MYLPLIERIATLHQYRGMRKRILFVSTQVGDPWGGCEELWSRTAQNLVNTGFDVIASVREWNPLHERVLSLIDTGIEVAVRPTRHPMWRRVFRRAGLKQEASTTAEVRRLINSKAPSLAVLSTGAAFPPIELLELCIEKKVPFVTIGTANQDAWWPEDSDARRYRNALPSALRCYFVSRANLLMAEKQIGCVLPNAEVVRVPFGVRFDESPDWPSSEAGELRFASLGRLHPPSKGQDILLEALAAPVWADRRWRLNLYGEGRMKDSLERLVHRLGLGKRVVFAGYAPAEKIWASNHVLVMPSRYEGLPIVVVEAMLCGRPVIATNVAGHSEVIEDGTGGFLADAPTVGSVAKALERFWERRSEAEQMGKAAATRIRQLVPPDPVDVFSEKIKQLVKTPK